MKKHLAGLVTLLVVGSLTLVSCGRKEAEKKAAGTRKRPPLAKDLKTQVHQAVEKAVAFLRKSQNPDGGWGAPDRKDPKKNVSDVGITGLVLQAILTAPKDIREKNRDLVDKAIAYVLSRRRPDGSFTEKHGGLVNYRTTIATVALILADREKYKDIIDAAVRFTRASQGTDPKNKAKYGSIGYGSDATKGDIINLGFALEMMARAGVSKDDEVWKRAMVFLFRTQSRDEGHPDGIRTSNDGGAIYRSVWDVKGASKAGTLRLPDGTVVPRSYGGATYTLLKSLLFAGLSKDHPRVQAAYRWICDHYTVKVHPEMGNQGLYFFYYTMARTLELWGSPTIRKGNVEHRWAEELAAELISQQEAQGSWFNEEPRWWEFIRPLATAYSVLSLNICDRMLGE